MRIAQTLMHRWPEDQPGLEPLRAIRPGLVLAFGDRALLATAGLAEGLAAAFPGAILAGCSTAGEIHGAQVHEGTLSLTAVDLGSLTCRAAATDLAGPQDSFAAGARLGRQLAGTDARAVLLFGQGVGINGTGLVDGLLSELPAGIRVGGGLAGDGGDFRETLVLDAEGLSHTRVLALGFGGERLQFANGSFGGWKAFGPLRKATRSEGNLLFELDGEPALDTYKRYLGEDASGLPASGLRFPLEMFSQDLASEGVIRTILAVDEASRGLVLAGDVDPEGYLRLMHAQIDALVDGAEEAARLALEGLAEGGGETLAVLVSCVGRKFVMGSRVDEEVEAAAERFGPGAKLAGFYSYGEFGPVPPGLACRLHNQTMTINLIWEVGG